MATITTAAEPPLPPPPLAPPTDPPFIRFTLRVLPPSRTPKPLFSLALAVPRAHSFGELLALLRDRADDRLLPNGLELDGIIEDATEAEVDLRDVVGVLFTGTESAGERVMGVPTRKVRKRKRDHVVVRDSQAQGEGEGEGEGLYMMSGGLGVAPTVLASSEHLIPPESAQRPVASPSKAKRKEKQVRLFVAEDEDEDQDAQLLSSFPADANANLSSSDDIDRFVYSKPASTIPKPKATPAGRSAFAILTSSQQQPSSTAPRKSNKSPGNPDKYTPDEDAALIRGRLAGSSSHVIGEEIGRTEGSVRGRWSWLCGKDPSLRARKAKVVAEPKKGRVGAGAGWSSGGVGGRSSPLVVGGRDVLKAMKRRRRVGGAEEERTEEEEDGVESDEEESGRHAGLRSDGVVLQSSPPRTRTLNLVRGEYNIIDDEDEEPARDPVLPSAAPAKTPSTTPTIAQPRHRAQQLAHAETGPARSSSPVVLIQVPTSADKKEMKKGEKEQKKKRDETAALASKDMVKQRGQEMEGVMAAIGLAGKKRRERGRAPGDGVDAVEGAGRNGKTTTKEVRTIDPAEEGEEEAEVGGELPKGTADDTSAQDKKRRAVLQHEAAAAPTIKQPNGTAEKNKQPRRRKKKAARPAPPATTTNDDEPDADDRSSDAESAPVEEEEGDDVRFSFRRDDRDDDETSDYAPGNAPNGSGELDVNGHAEGDGNGDEAGGGGGEDDDDGEIQYLPDGEEDAMDVDVDVDVDGGAEIEGEEEEKTDFERLEEAVGAVHTSSLDLGDDAIELAAADAEGSAVSGKAVARTPARATTRQTRARGSSSAVAPIAAAEAVVPVARSVRARGSSLAPAAAAVQNGQAGPGAATPEVVVPVPRSSLARGSSIATPAAAAMANGHPSREKPTPESAEPQTRSSRGRQSSSTRDTTTTPAALTNGIAPGGRHARSRAYITARNASITTLEPEPEPPKLSYNQRMLAARSASSTTSTAKSEASATSTPARSSGGRLRSATNGGSHAALLRKVREVEGQARGENEEKEDRVDEEEEESVQQTPQGLREARRLSRAATRREMDSDGPVSAPAGEVVEPVPAATRGGALGRMGRPRRAASTRLTVEANASESPIAAENQAARSDQNSESPATQPYAYNRAENERIAAQKAAITAKRAAKDAAIEKAAAQRAAAGQNVSIAAMEEKQSQAEALKKAQQLSQEIEASRQFEASQSLVPSGSRQRRARERIVAGKLRKEVSVEEEVPPPRRRRQPAHSGILIGQDVPLDIHQSMALLSAAHADETIGPLLRAAEDKKRIDDAAKARAAPIEPAEVETKAPPRGEQEWLAYAREHVENPDENPQQVRYFYLDVKHADLFLRHYDDDVEVNRLARQKRRRLWGVAVGVGLREPEHGIGVQGKKVRTVAEVDGDGEEAGEASEDESVGTVGSWEFGEVFGLKASWEESEPEGQEEEELEEEEHFDMSVDHEREFEEIESVVEDGHIEEDMEMPLADDAGITVDEAFEDDKPPRVVHINNGEAANILPSEPHRADAHSTATTAPFLPAFLASPGVAAAASSGQAGAVPPPPPSDNADRIRRFSDFTRDLPSTQQTNGTQEDGTVLVMQSIETETERKRGKSVGFMEVEVAGAVLGEGGRVVMSPVVRRVFDGAGVEDVAVVRKIKLTNGSASGVEHLRASETSDVAVTEAEGGDEVVDPMAEEVMKSTSPMHFRDAVVENGHVDDDAASISSDSEESESEPADEVITPNPKKGTSRLAKTASAEPALDDNASAEPQPDSAPAESEAESSDEANGSEDEQASTTPEPKPREQKSTHPTEEAKGTPQPDVRFSEVATQTTPSVTKSQSFALTSDAANFESEDEAIEADSPTQPAVLPTPETKKSKRMKLAAGRTPAVAQPIIDPATARKPRRKRSSTHLNTAEVSFSTDTTWSETQEQASMYDAYLAPATTITTTPAAMASESRRKRERKRLKRRRESGIAVAMGDDAGEDESLVVVEDDSVDRDLEMEGGAPVSRKSKLTKKKKEKRQSFAAAVDGHDDAEEAVLVTGPTEESQGEIAGPPDEDALPATTKPNKRRRRSSTHASKHLSDGHANETATPSRGSLARSSASADKPEEAAPETQPTQSNSDDTQKKKKRKRKASSDIHEPESKTRKRARVDDNDNAASKSIDIAAVGKESNNMEPNAVSQSPAPSTAPTNDSTTPPPSLPSKKSNSLMLPPPLPSTRRSIESIHPTRHERRRGTDAAKRLGVQMTVPAPPRAREAKMTTTATATTARWGARDVLAGWAGAGESGESGAESSVV